VVHLNLAGGFGGADVINARLVDAALEERSVSLEPTRTGEELGHGPRPRDLLAACRSAFAWHRGPTG
jgi:hypothetical protein